METPPPPTKKGQKSKHTQNGVQVENNRNGRQKKTNQPFPVGQTIETGRWSSRLPFLFPFWLREKQKKRTTNKQAKKPQKRWKPGKKKLGKTQVIPQFPRRPMVKSKKKRRPTLGDRRGRKPLFFFYLLHRSFSARHGFVATSRFSFNARAKKNSKLFSWRPKKCPKFVLKALFLWTAYNEETFFSFWNWNERRNDHFLNYFQVILFNFVLFSLLWPKNVRKNIKNCKFGRMFLFFSLNWTSTPPKKKNPFRNLLKSPENDRWLVGVGQPIRWRWWTDPPEGTCKKKEKKTTKTKRNHAVFLRRSKKVRRSSPKKNKRKTRKLERRHSTGRLARSDGTGPFRFVDRRANHRRPLDTVRSKTP